MKELSESLFKPSTLPGTQVVSIKFDRADIYRLQCYVRFHDIRNVEGHLLSVPESIFSMVKCFLDDRYSDLESGLILKDTGGKLDDRREELKGFAL